MNNIILNEYKKWLNSDLFTNDEKNELKKIENDKNEISDRFYQNLVFGTAGMRGIRGIGKNRMNIYNVRKATQGLANYIIETAGEKGRERGVAIAYDCRIDSLDNAKAASEVLAGNGIKVHLYKGVHSTPELSFAVRELNTISGIVITASHNPKEYNGYKVYWEDGAQIADKEAEGIIKEVNNTDIFNDIKILNFDDAIKKGLILYIDKVIEDRYLEEVTKQIINTDIPNKSNFKIVYSPLHGTGAVPIKKLFDMIGFYDLNIVKEQEEPNGNFPTCPYANPEDTTVFALSTKLADEIGAKICMANDPDADRVGIAIKDNEDNWFFPSGNQIGILIFNYILSTKKNLPKNATIITTIVSTPMIDVIAKDNNINVIRTLTGFKYIGQKIREFETGKLDGTFIFGFEEAIGFLIGTHVRDKDGIVSAMILAEMAAYYDSLNSSLYKELINIYNRYGWFLDETIAITKKGQNGLEEIDNMMSKLRDTKIENLFGKFVEKIKDFNEGIENLPKSNVIQFILDDNTYITVRPSGTEPKIKYYFSIVENNEESAKAKLKDVVFSFQDFVNSL